MKVFLKKIHFIVLFIYMITSRKYLNRLFEMSGIKSKPRTLFNEINVEDVSIPKEFIKDNLNSVLWDEDKNLKEEVRTKIFEIVDEFKESLKLKLEPEDVKIVGSMVDYNWNDKSDIDIHLFYDLEKISKNKEFAKEYLEAKKSLWNNAHDIKFKDFDIELYAQDKDDDYYSGGVFSVLKNKWERIPEKENVKVDNHALKNKIIGLVNSIEDLEQEKLNPVLKYNKADKIKNKIKKMRQSGLENGGVFSIENLAFKYLRNNNFIGRLIDIMTKSYDESLSIKQ